MRRIPPIGFFLVEIRDRDEETSTGFMVASGGVLSERYGDGGPGVCLGDGQTLREYRRKVDAATRCSGVCLFPDLTYGGKITAWRENWYTLIWFSLETYLHELLIFHHEGLISALEHLKITTLSVLFFNELFWTKRLFFQKILERFLFNFKRIFVNLFSFRHKRQFKFFSRQTRLSLQWHKFPNLSSSFQSYDSSIHFPSNTLTSAQ